MPAPPLLTVLARSFLAGETGVEQIVGRASRTLGRSWRWLRPLAHKYVEFVAGTTRPRHRDVVQLLLQDAGFQRAWLKYRHELSVDQCLPEFQHIHPVTAAVDWDLPVIDSAGALADWFWLDPGALEWFADLKALGYKNNRPLLRHYRYRVLTKRFGSIRLIEAPKPRLKEMQRQILAQILDKIPMHPTAHGFVQGR